MTEISMWNSFDDFELDIGEDWNLYLSEKLSFQCPSGTVHGRISLEHQGIELRKNEEFISSRPLYVLFDDPHPGNLGLWLAEQKVFGRDDCVGCKALIKKKFQKLPKSRRLRLTKETMYLGSDPSLCEWGYLVEVVQNAVYKIEDKNHFSVGYIFTINIQGVDAERFHSDEGHYEVGVIQGSGFIALLGCQNELNWYALDRLKGKVDLSDLSKFDKHARTYWKQLHWSYKHIHGPRGSCGFSLGPGTYVLEPYNQKVKKEYIQIDECKLKGENSFGEKLEFAASKFGIRKSRSTDSNSNSSREIVLTGGGHCTVWDGNIVITDREEVVYRMYTDLLSIEYGPHHSGNMEKYDKDPKKTLAKLVDSMAQAVKEYEAVPVTELSLQQ